MKVIIEISKEFKQHFFNDRFDDSLLRCINDLANFGCLAGNYEIELLEMLNKAFNTCDVIIPNNIVKEFIETERNDEE